jgi:hypothetical protein
VLRGEARDQGRDLGCRFDLRIVADRQGEHLRVRPLLPGPNPDTRTASRSPCQTVEAVVAHDQAVVGELLADGVERGQPGGIGGTDEAHQRHHEQRAVELLAALGGALRLSRPLARRGHALGAAARADDLAPPRLDAIWLRLRQLGSVTLARKLLEGRAREMNLNLDAGTLHT